MNTPLRILHLEDDATSAELVCSTLLQEGLPCEVVRVDTREGFVKALDDGGFDLILADYSLPSFDGVSALSIASEKCPDVPFLFVSGTMGEEISVESLKKGATDYILKSGLSRLAPSVRRAVREAAERAEKKAAEANVKRLNRVYAFLGDANQLIIRTTDRQALFDGACRIAVEKGLFRMAWVGLVDEAAGMVRPLACAGCEEGYLKDMKVSTGDEATGSGPTGTAVRTGMHFINNDTKNNPAMQPWREAAMKRGYLSSAAFPLIVEGKAVGAVTVYAAVPGFFDEENVHLLDELAANISYALSSIEQEESQRRAEDKARELDERLRALVEESPVGSFIIQDACAIYANPGAMDMFGYERLDGRNIFDFVHPDDLERAREVFSRLVSGEEKKCHAEIRVLRADNSFVETEIFGFYNTYQGRPAIIGSVLDITERKRLEMEQADFYAMVTHDMKSPLTAIELLAEMLWQSKAVQADHDALDTASEIQKNSTKLLGLVDDFLAFSRMSSGKAGLKETLVDVPHLLEGVLEEFFVPAKEKGLRLEKRIAEGIPKLLLDKRQFERAITNLLQNAVNYTPAGGSVALEAERLAAADGESIVVSVSDTGPGIPPLERARVFDRYFRAPNVSGIKGSGLGLAIVKAVVEAHGGRVELEGREGPGSTFRIIIPI